VHLRAEVVLDGFLGGLGVGGGGHCSYSSLRSNLSQAFFDGDMT
jgi:hypothetical protein